jgi:hypothetical protein
MRNFDPPRLKPATALKICGCLFSAMLGWLKKRGRRREYCPGGRVEADDLTFG